jgi:hypothetical protein
MLLALPSGYHCWPMVIITLIYMNLFGMLEQKIATIVVIASMVTLLCMASIANGLNQRSQKEQVTRIRAEKASIYERLLFLWAKRLQR